MAQKIVKIGSSLGVIIPKESAQKIGWKAGDRVEVKANERNRSVAILPLEELSQEDERVLRHGLEFIKRYRKDLEALARK